MRFAFLIVGIIAWMVVRGWIMPKNERQGRIFRILTPVTGTLVVLAFSWAMYWPHHVVDRSRGAFADGNWCWTEGECESRGPKPAAIR